MAFIIAILQTDGCHKRRKIWSDFLGAVRAGDGVEHYDREDWSARSNVECDSLDPAISSEEEKTRELLVEERVSKPFDDLRHGIEHEEPGW